MELKDYTTEELKAEIKRRTELAKAQKAEEMKTAKRCRNCKHCQKSVVPWSISYKCMARTWGTKYPRNYTVYLSKKACEKFEHK